MVLSNRPGREKSRDFLCLRSVNEAIIGYGSSPVRLNQGNSSYNQGVFIMNIESAQPKEQVKPGADTTMQSVAGQIYESLKPGDFSQIGNAGKLADQGKDGKYLPPLSFEGTGNDHISKPKPDSKPDGKPGMKPDGKPHDGLICVKPGDLPPVETKPGIEGPVRIHPADPKPGLKPTFKPTEEQGQKPVDKPLGESNSIFGRLHYPPGSKTPVLLKEGDTK